MSDDRVGLAHLQGNFANKASLEPAIPSNLKAQLDALSAFAAQPAFIGALKEIQDAPEADRLGVATKIATVEALQERGLEPPHDFRISLRVFEDVNEVVGSNILIDGPARFLPENSLSAITVCASVGYIVCASVGGEV